jgi:hypothetical protein
MAVTVTAKSGNGAGRHEAGQPAEYAKYSKVSCEDLAANSRLGTDLVQALLR